MLTLIEAAWRALPAIEELPIAESWVGFRPGSRDDAPMLGASGIDGLVIATGHHRNGILLTPVSAAVIADYIVSGSLPEMARPFDPRRFAAKAGGDRTPRRRNDPAQDQRRRGGRRGDDDRPACWRRAASTRGRAFSRSRSTARWCAAPTGRRPDCRPATRSRLCARCREVEAPSSLRAQQSNLAPERTPTEIAAYLEPALRRREAATRVAPRNDGMFLSRISP